MKFEFQKQISAEVVVDIREYIEEKDLPIKVTDFVTYIKLHISKWGTSTFTFEISPTTTGALVLTLTHKKIHFLHKSYKEQFKQELVKAMESIGGKKL